MHPPSLKEAHFIPHPEFPEQKVIQTQVDWPPHGTFSLYIDIEDPKDGVQSENYELIRKHWSLLISLALSKLAALPAEYENPDFGFSPAEGSLMLTVPSEAVAKGAEWTISYEGSTGWMVRFEGLEYVDGQGLF